jgi:tetratricopeptide (TPR) repeat protein
MLLQKLEALEVPEGLEVLRAAIIYREEGPEKAIEVLARQTDPEARRLEAALLLETGNFIKAIETLKAVRPGGSRDAEVLRLHAAACLSLGEGEEAFSLAQAALSLQPEWLSVRMAFAIAGYFTSLSPAALPEHVVAWPQPVSWALVRRDDESAERRRRAAEVALKALKEADLDGENRRLLESLHLACLACDSERREEAESFCQELLRRDNLHVPAIAWALGRGFQFDLGKSRRALQRRFNAGRSDLNQTITLVACYLRDNRGQQAASVLQRAREAFEKEGQLGLWLVQEAQLPVSKDAQDKFGGASRDLEIAVPGPAGRLAKVLNAQAEHNTQELGRLAKTALKEGSIAAVVEACETLARQRQWGLLAPLAAELVEKIGTADAARMAALAIFNQGRYEECLELLSRAEPLFPGRKLSADLRRLRVETLKRLGRSPEAIALAEQIVRDEKAPEDLLNLVNLHWEKGDLSGAAFHARGLSAQTDLPPEEGLRIAMRIVSADPEVARDLFKKAIQAGISNELLPTTIYLAQRLGDWVEAQPLVAGLIEVAITDENGPVRMITQDNLQEFQRYAAQAAQEATRLEAAYMQGEFPVHSLVGPLNLSLAWLLSPIRSPEEREKRPESPHPPIFLCHGGRGVPSRSELPPSPQEWHLHLDTTALLVADALGILPTVEQLFAPLSVPQNLPVALMHIEELEERRRHSVVVATLSEAAAALDELGRLRRIQWIRELRTHLSHGIDRRIYRCLPESSGFRAHRESLEEDRPPEYLTLIELLAVEPAPGNFIWLADRLATAFVRSPGGPIVGVTDLLVALEVYGGITREQRFEKLHLLRSAGARYFPLSFEELLYHLRSAPVEEGRVVETPELGTLRRYFASCFASAELLQPPSAPEGGHGNTHGEIWFLNSFERAIQATLIQIFEDEKSTQKERLAQADFVWENLRIEDSPSLIHPNRCEADWLSWLALHVAELLVSAVLLAGGRASEAAVRGNDLLAWLEHSVIQTGQRANPGLAKEIVRFVKELILVRKGRSAKKLPENALRAFKFQFVHRMPDSIRNLLLADEEVLAELSGISESIAEFDDLAFSARKLWNALEVAARGEPSQISTRVGARQFAVNWITQATDSHEVYLEELPRGIRVHIADPLLGLVVGDVTERLTLLAQNRSWLDHSEPERDAWIEQVALQPEVWCRVEMVLEARKKSSAWYYRELADTARKPNIDISELLPPSLDSLLRYHRLDRSLAATDFPEALDQGAGRLLVEEGLAEALRRLAGLPVPLPCRLLEALSQLDAQSREEIIQRALGGPESPMSRFQRVRIHLYLLGKPPAGSKVFAPLAEPLWEATNLRWVEAFVTLLRWVDRQFEFWEETLAAPASLRLALTWSHAHHLTCAIAGIGAQPEDLCKAFSATAAEGALRPNILFPNLSLLDDVTHPMRVEAESLLFHGTLFALGNRLPEGLTASGEGWWARLTMVETEDGRGFRLPFLQAHRSAGDLLGSFLTWDRWQSLAGLIDSSTLWSPFPEELILGRMKQALEQLVAEQSNFDSWVVLSGVTGTLVPSQGIVRDLTQQLLVKFDFVELFRKAPREASGILRWAAEITARLANPAASEQIRKQILVAAEMLRKEVPKPQGDDGEVEAFEVFWANYFMSVSRWASLKIGDSAGSAEQFANQVGRLADAWPEIQSLIRRGVERLSRTVPLEQALRLRPLVLRLRTMDGHGESLM